MSLGYSMFSHFLIFAIIRSELTYFATFVFSCFQSPLITHLGEKEKMVKLRGNIPDTGIWQKYICLLVLVFQCTFPALVISICKKLNKHDRSLCCHSFCIRGVGKLCQIGNLGRIMWSLSCLPPSSFSLCRASLSAENKTFLLSR